MEVGGNHDFSDVDFKKGFKKPLPWIILLIMIKLKNINVY